MSDGISIHVECHGAFLFVDVFECREKKTNKQDRLPTREKNPSLSCMLYSFPSNKNKKLRIYLFLTTCNIRKLVPGAASWDFKGAYQSIRMLHPQCMRCSFSLELFVRFSSHSCRSFFPKDQFLFLHLILLFERNLKP